VGESIQDAMALAGLHPHKPLDLIADGLIHRFRLDGDKSGSRNGWAVLNDGPPSFGAFGSWKTGESHTWREASSKPLTPAEQAAIAQRMRDMRIVQAQALELVRAEARAKAQKLWGRGHWATNKHPYLERKQVNAYGIKLMRDMLLIPARDINGTMHTLQFIMPDGGKKFLTGGRIAGCYFAIGKPVDRLLLAEGLSTGSSLYAATGAAVAVCFSAGNLLAVALALRSKFPRLKLVLCADNDVNTPGNPGLTKAREAAKAVGGYLAVPAINHEMQPCPF
jgi:putative DNA primase/helicase